ncbi:nuclear transport factor 2 family protein [Kribbella sp. NBC_00709]|uniref:nuclear transport factor 2 family protein n=1 Tax=Kribbella sp. NBC_00709 TaxID=2975972 RepID=UPI002E2D3F18|nr:nuclear transport factor 2 family protein [Kribbella sp. NBC_00709]
MPWFPEFSTAIELARRDARAREQADPVAQYLKALYDGRPGVLEKAWPGDVVVHDPRAGAIHGHRELRTFIHDNREWMAAHHSRLKVVGSITVGGRAVVELLVHVLHEGREVAWPVAVVAQSVDERSVEFRTYCSQWPVDGLRHIRPPVLEAGAVETTDVVARYLDTLAGGDAESIVKSFEPDGYLQEPMDTVHRGTAELRAFYAGSLSAGGIDVQPCAATDDGTNCALEYNIDGPPQAGLAVFERGADGLLAAVRLYDDITR